MNDLDRTTPQPPGMGASQPPPSGVHQPPPGAHFMNVLRWSLFAFLMVLAAISIGTYVISRRPESVAKRAASRVVYQCPMHPSYTSDKPGECPICGMTLEPVRTDGAVASGPRRIVYYRNPMKPSVTSPVPTKDEMGMDYVPVYSDEGSAVPQGDVPGLTSVRITPERIQMIGVRTARVERSSLGGELELVGFVTPDESRIKRIQIRVSGWIRQLYVNQTGAQVRAGQPLLSIYSPELFQTEQEFLIEQGAGDSSGMGHLGRAGGATQRLSLLGVPDQEIHRLEREGTATTQLTLSAPVDGTVLERGVVEGQYVGADTPLLTVADLSRVWVMADLYEMDFTRVRVGDRARFTADALINRPFDGRVQFIYPIVSNETRTLKARLVFDNADGMLRPGMYGRVKVSGRASQALSVPSEAVVNTGEHSYVFIAHAGGRFEPRMVWTGLPEGDRIQVIKGVAEGDTVVSSASFLIDSESRLKAAVEGMGAQTGTPGMEHQHGGQP
jgi:multidrug efflux pump subunit AcrA (membrane-fusion protein)